MPSKETLILYVVLMQGMFEMVRDRTGCCFLYMEKRVLMKLKSKIIAAFRTSLNF